MDELKKLMIAFIAKTQGKSDAEVSSLLFKTEADGSETVQESALTGLLDWDKARVNAFGIDGKVKESYDKGYNKAKAESLSKFEKELRDKYQITEEKQGAELVESILAQQASKNGTGEPTEDQVKRSKVYLDTLTQLKTEKDAAVKEWKDKLEARENQLSKEAVYQQVSKRSLESLRLLDPILPEDEELAKEWENIFVSRMNEFDYEIKDPKSTPLVLVKQEDGTTKVLLDDHGHPVSFDEVVKKKASSLFKFKEGKERTGAGNSNNNEAAGAGKKVYTGPAPKDAAEYAKMIGEAKSLEEKEGIMKLWEEGQKK